MSIKYTPDTQELSAEPLLVGQRSSDPSISSTGAIGTGEVRATAAQPPDTFAATALKLGGKSEEEIRRTGAVDRADDQVESLFDRTHRTAMSPIHQAVWGERVPLDLFSVGKTAPSLHAAAVMDDSIDVVRRYQTNGHLYDSRGKLSAELLADLGSVGYWGLLVPREYGGFGAPFGQFASFITRMAVHEPTVAGLASVHSCIGAVDPVVTFGNSDQKQRYLPQLASGAKLSGFALTEPGAGSDLTALRTTAVRRGDHYYVTGAKLFITNADYGRTIGLVCLIEGKPAVLVVDLPQQPTAEFSIRTYGLYALHRAHNQGLVFQEFPVPVANRLDAGDGDGLTIAYHGLNRGRVALCANAAGVMRMMLASMVPWAQFRKTYGHAIVSRELVQRRLGHLAGLITAADALTDWTAGLLDQGYRGEMECIVAKIFGSEALKEAAIELFMKTHGGRSFLHGHVFGDNVHDFLAPCIYEGEGEMLGMAFFKSLVKQHARDYFEPIGLALAARGLKQPKLLDPGCLWALKGPLMKYAGWYGRRWLHGGGGTAADQVTGVHRRHAEFAAEFLQRSALEISTVMRKHQLKLADRQCRMAELSGRIQTATVILVTSLWAGRHESELVRLAGATICDELQCRLTGGRVSDRYLRSVTELGASIGADPKAFTAGMTPDSILMPYAR